MNHLIAIGKLYHYMNQGNRVQPFDNLFITGIVNYACTPNLSVAKSLWKPMTASHENATTLATTIDYGICATRIQWYLGRTIDFTHGLAAFREAR